MSPGSANRGASRSSIVHRALVAKASRYGPLAEATHHLRPLHDAAPLRLQGKIGSGPFYTVRQDFHSSCAPGLERAMARRLADHAHQFRRARKKANAVSASRSATKAPYCNILSRHPSFAWHATDVAIPITRQCPTQNHVQPATTRPWTTLPSPTVFEIASDADGEDRWPEISPSGNSSGKSEISSNVSSLQSWLQHSADLETLR